MNHFAKKYILRNSQNKKTWQFCSREELIFQIYAQYLRHVSNTFQFASFLWNINETRRPKHRYRSKNIQRGFDSWVFLFRGSTASWMRGPIWELRIKSKLKQHTEMRDWRGTPTESTMTLCLGLVSVKNRSQMHHFMPSFIVPVWGHLIEAWRKRNVTNVNGPFFRLSRSFCRHETQTVLIHDAISPKHFC